MSRQDAWISNGVRWAPALAVMATIFVFSSIPSKEMPDFRQLDLLLKKSGHLFGYALLASAYWHGLGKATPRALGLAWLLAVFYAVTDEFHQSFVPGRTAWVGDVVIDSVGALFGLLSASMLWRR